MRPAQKMAATAFLRPTWNFGGMRRVGELKQGTPCVHFKKPLEPVMGFEPMASVLPRLCATPAPHGPTGTYRRYTTSVMRDSRAMCRYGWAVQDSNLRSSRN